MAVSLEHHSLGLTRLAAEKGFLLPGKAWAYLGNQRLRAAPAGGSKEVWAEWFGSSIVPDKPLPTCHGRGIQSVKPWMEWFGCECVMWDYNGKDGAIQHDLTLPVDQKYFGHFDVVTNFGTSEHVLPTQIQCFKTMHDLCKVGGLMLHAVPGSGCNRHGSWKYPLEWFAKQCFAQNYNMLDGSIRPVPHNRGAGPHLYSVIAFEKLFNGDFNESNWSDPLPTER